MFGFQLPRELRLPVHRRSDPRVLAALAHLAVDLVPRLPLHPARRQPARRAARPTRNLVDRVPAVRPLARRELDLRALGRSATARSSSSSAPGCGARARAAAGSFRHAYALLVVMGGWVFFRCRHAAARAAYLRGACSALARDRRAPAARLTSRSGCRGRRSSSASCSRRRSRAGRRTGAMRHGAALAAAARSCARRPGWLAGAVRALRRRSSRPAPTIRSSISGSDMRDAEGDIVLQPALARPVLLLLPGADRAAVARRADLAVE